VNRLLPWAFVIALTLAAGLLYPGDGRSPATDSPTIAGYVAPWDPRSRAALDRPPKPLTEISPVWYQATETGDVVFASDEASKSADESGNDVAPLRLVPSVSNFRAGRWDGELISLILRDPQRRARHLDALVSLARSAGAAGVDLDYESLQPADRNAYAAFVRDLASAVRRAGRMLTVTVHAKTSETDGAPGARAQDWRQLGAAADELRIMAYDHSWPDSPPGPVAPVAWVDPVLAYAVRQVSPAKVLLGLPTYGYDWPHGGAGQDLDWADVTALAARHNGQVRWDEASQSPWFSYRDENGVDHVVWFENARSMQAKVALARRYGVAGVALWKLGGEDPGVWQVLRAIP
jgi:spore germination protein YaaH